MDNEINEWKEQWNNGDVKFVPELFELVERLQEENDLLSEHCAKLEKPIIDKIMDKLNSKSR